MNQRGSLERLSGFFLGHLLRGQTPQFAVDQR